jgi:hypothetical protein
MSGVLFREDPTWGLSVRENKRDGQLKLIPAKALTAIGVYDINHKSSA